MRLPRVFCDSAGLCVRGDLPGLRERDDLTGLTQTTPPCLMQSSSISYSSVCCEATLSSAHARPPFSFFFPTLGGLLAPLSFFSALFNFHASGNVAVNGIFNGLK